MSYEGVVHKSRLPSNHFFLLEKKETYPKKDLKNEKTFYVYNIFITNIMW